MAQWSSREVERLRRVLAELYPESRTARTLVEDAGLSSTDIDFGGASSTMWASILRYAKPRNAIDAVLDKALADNPGHQELLKANRHEPLPLLTPERTSKIARGGLVLVLAVAVVFGIGIGMLFSSLWKNEADFQGILVEQAQAPLVPAAVSVLPTGGWVELLPSVEETRRLLSPDAIDLILAFEIGSTAGQDLPAHVIANSLTIGIGYDLGLVSPEQFARDWSARLSADLLARLDPWVGRKDVPSDYKVEGIVIPWGAAYEVFVESSVRRIVGDILELPRTDELPPDAFGALVSLAYNLGINGFFSSSDRNREMRRIHELLASGEFTAIPEQIRSMKRLWPDLPGLQRRRDAEALLFEIGLSRQQLQGVFGRRSGSTPT